MPTFLSGTCGSLREGLSYRVRGVVIDLPVTGRRARLFSDPG